MRYSGMLATTLLFTALVVVVSATNNSVNFTATTSTTAKPRPSINTANGDIILRTSSKIYRQLLETEEMDTLATAREVQTGLTTGLDNLEKLLTGQVDSVVDALGKYRLQTDRILTELDSGVKANADAIEDGVRRDSETKKLLTTTVQRVGTAERNLARLEANIQANQRAVTALQAADRELKNKVDRDLTAKIEEARKSSVVTSQPTMVCNAANSGKMRINGDAGEICMNDGWLTFAQPPLGSSKNRPAKSCKDARENGALKSGVYWIKPDSNSAFEAYCDQTNDGGGWTLVIKTSTGGATRNWAYNSNWWGRTSGINTNRKYFTNLADNTDHMSLAYARLPFTQVRIAMKTQDNVRIDTHNRKHLRNLMYETSNAGSGGGREFAMRTVSKMGMSTSWWNNQGHCNLNRWNMIHSGGWGHYFRCRYGWVGNNENDCLTVDSAVGLGCFTNGQYHPNHGRSVGSGAFTWSPFRKSYSNGWIYVR